MTQGSEDSKEELEDRVMKVVQRVLGAGFPRQVLQEHTVLRIAMSCQDQQAEWKLIDNPPISIDEAVWRVKSTNLADKLWRHGALGIHSLSLDGQLSGGEQSISPSPAPRSDLYRSVRRDGSQRQVFRVCRILQDGQ